MSRFHGTAFYRRLSTGVGRKFVHRIGRLSTGVGRRYPAYSVQGVVDGRVLEAGVSTASRDRSTVGYTAAEWTRTKMALCNVVAPAPHPAASGMRHMMSTF